MFNQRKRKCFSQLRALYAAANQEIDAETASLQLEHQRITVAENEGRKKSKPMAVGSSAAADVDVSSKLPVLPTMPPITTRPHVPIAIGVTTATAQPSCESQREAAVRGNDMDTDNNVNAQMSPSRLPGWCFNTRDGGNDDLQRRSSGKGKGNGGRPSDVLLTFGGGHTASVETTAAPHPAVASTDEEVQKTAAGLLAQVEEEEVAGVYNKATKTPPDARLFDSAPPAVDATGGTVSTSPKTAADHQRQQQQQLHEGEEEATAAGEVLRRATTAPVARSNGAVFLLAAADKVAPDRHPQRGRKAAGFAPGVIVRGGTPVGHHASAFKRSRSATAGLIEMNASSSQRLGLAPGGSKTQRRRKMARLSNQDVSGTSVRGVFIPGAGVGIAAEARVSAAESSRSKDDHKVSIGPMAAKGSARTAAFAELNVCAIHLGAVTKGTVATWKRSVESGGGTLTTTYVPGETTHIVADASLSLETLDGYSWRWQAGDLCRGGVPADVSGGVAPDSEVPIVGGAWMVECLRRWTVVSVEPHRMRRHPDDGHPAPAVRDDSTGAPRFKEETTAGGRGKASMPALSRKSGEADRGRRKGGAQSGGGTRDRRKGGSRAGSVAGETGNDGGGGAEKAVVLRDSGVVKGGFGGANTDVAKRKGKFFCQSGGSRDHRPCNEEAAKMLESLSEVYLAVGGEGSGWREKGFKRAAAVLRGLGTQISGVQQLRDLKKTEPGRVRGLGESALKLLEEFYSAGTMGRLEGLASQSKVKALRAFQKIWGVGPKKAEELEAAGFRTIEGVRESGREMLNIQQLVGLDRYEDLLERMPRAEAAEIEATVAAAAKKLCPEVHCQACGSYRRGKDACGDVDVLIRPPEGHEDCSIMLPLLESLRSSGFITDDLSLPKEHRTGHSQSYMGVCKLPGEGRRYRRLDVKLYPTSMFGFALLYFTGSGHFNCSMRYYAKMQGLSLSDKGLKAVNRVAGEKVHSFPSYSCPREEDVFTALGLEWRCPRDRSGYDVHPTAGDMKSAMGSGTLAGAPGEDDDHIEAWEESAEEDMLD